jgi:hypothetical protein
MGDVVSSGGLIDTSKNGHDTIYFNADCMLRSWYLICNLVCKGSSNLLSCLNYVFCMFFFCFSIFATKENTLKATSHHVIRFRVFFCIEFYEAGRGPLRSCSWNYK